MGIVEQLKRLHKQTLLKMGSIKRVEVASNAGVDSEEYLSRARTLDSFINKENESEAEAEGKEEEEEANEAQQAVPSKTKVSRPRKSKTNIEL